MISEISKKRILLVYPQMGMSGALVCHIPLSLIYAAAEVSKTGFAVKIIDLRLYPGAWQEKLQAAISPDILLVGLSVMSGTPVINALAISRWVKRQHPNIPVVWGGAHTLFNSKEVLVETTVDYVISGYGSYALDQLARNLAGHSDALPLSSIPGLVFRSPDNSGIISVPVKPFFEIHKYRDIPYHLVENNLKRYGQLDTEERIFPLYGSMGCPYKCAFCSSPAQYAGMANRYILLSPKEVADHIEFVVSRYGATYIYFIDDDSFVDLKHVEEVIDEIGRREIKVGLGFRGARVSEIKRMDDQYLTKLAGAGTNILHIGAESGSQRMLDLMQKDCTVQDILDVNRKLAQHPEITAAYNWLIGLPGETVKDLQETRALVLKLLEENPAAIIFTPNKYRPLPGTELYEIAVRYGYRPPATLEGWADMEFEGNFHPPWYSRKFSQEIKMMQVVSYFIDKKLFKVSTGNTVKYLVVKLIAMLYTPIAKFRYRTGFSYLLVEHMLFRFVVKRFRKQV